MTVIPIELGKEVLERRARQARVLSKHTPGLAASLGLTPSVVAGALADLLRHFHISQFDSAGTEHAAKAKADARQVAKKAEELTEALRALGPGAVEVMNRLTGRQDLTLDAEPFALPGSAWDDPRLPPPDSDEEVDDYEENLRRGGRWVIRLQALAELARVSADWIEEETRKGGRASFATRLNGESSEDTLARACKEFVASHGCQSQAVVLSVMRAILEAAHGEIAPQAGRRAVSKMFQTPLKLGTV